jgi:hypothetical protein
VIFFPCQSISSFMPSQIHMTRTQQKISSIMCDV